jgi:hypothetical protein
MEYSIDKAKEELQEVNSVLSCYMKKKRALQTYILEHNEKVLSDSSLESMAWFLKHDPTFIEEHKRERTQEEVGRIMGYSPRQVRRFLKEKDS